MFDDIIVLGNIVGKRFDSFSCFSSTNIYNLLYDVEERTFLYRGTCANNKLLKISKRSTITIQNIEEDVVDDYLGYAEESDIDEELEEYISVMDDLSVSYSIDKNYSSGKGSVSTEIIAVATFEDDRKAFFSKQYKAYVFDSGSGETKEVSVSDLCEGDAVVFTKNNDDTKDIVDLIMGHLINNNKLSEQQVENYNKSKEWKKVLINYMNKNDYSASEVAEKMVEIGAPVQEPTIKKWLDEDAHTVGPRSENSFKVIGELTGNSQLVESSDLYYIACKDIRSIRRKILKQIGIAIIDKIGGKKPIDNSIESEIYDKIDDLSEVLQIERIVPINKYVPLGLANRPIDIRG